MTKRNILTIHTTVIRIITVPGKNIAINSAPFLFFANATNAIATNKFTMVNDQNFR